MTDKVIATMRIGNTDVLSEILYINKKDDSNEQWSGDILTLIRPLQIIYEHRMFIDFAPMVHFVRNPYVIIKTENIIWMENASQDGIDQYDKYCAIHYPTVEISNAVN